MGAHEAIRYINLINLIKNNKKTERKLYHLYYIIAIFVFEMDGIFCFNKGVQHTHRSLARFKPKVVIVFILLEERERKSNFENWI